jgi:hypothetical protein
MPIACSNSSPSYLNQIQHTKENDSTIKTSNKNKTKKRDNNKTNDIKVGVQF